MYRDYMFRQYIFINWYKLSLHVSAKISHCQAFYIVLVNVISVEIGFQIYQFLSNENRMHEANIKILRMFSSTSSIITN
jgi:general stress protein CsbA